MQYVKRSPCPKLLSDNQTLWTKPWLAHYHWQKGISDEPEKPDKPKDGYWREDDIRLLLIKDFHNNCGYCGMSLPTPSLTDEEPPQPLKLVREGEREFASKGDVDHLQPKAIYPEKVYQWFNYIWSCKPCNQRKQEFDSIEYPLLNPCCEVDCGALAFVENTGRYVLKEKLAEDKYWKKRLSNSIQKTLVNAIEYCDNRRDSISILRRCFTSIERSLNNIKELQGIPELETVIDSLQQQVTDDKLEIKQNMHNIQFYLLKQAKFHQLQQQFPLASAWLNNDK